MTDNGAQAGDAASDEASRSVATVERYAAACTARRDGEIAELFALDAEVRDPYDGSPVHGREAIHEFFRRGVEMIDLLVPSGPVRVTADGAHAAVPMHVEVTFSGTALELDTVHVFHFDADGLIAAMHAFYGPSNTRPVGTPRVEQP